ncbi:MAG TPA: GAF domain-containing protein [Cyclobacteriaceae bacterium]
MIFFYRQINSLNILIALCLFTSIVLTVQVIGNKQKLVRHSVAALGAKNVMRASYGILYAGLSDVDKDVRGLAVSQSKVYEEYFLASKNRSKQSIDTLRQYILQQKATFPDFSLRLDSAGMMTNVLQDSLASYYKFCDLIVDQIYLNNTEAVKTMIGFDRGMNPWRTWQKLDIYLAKLEADLEKKTYDEYGQSNLIITTLIGIVLFLCIPTGILIRRKILSAERARKEMIGRLEQTNRDYLYNNQSEQQDHANSETTINETIVGLKEASKFVTALSENNFQEIWSGFTEDARQANANTLAGQLHKLRESLITSKNDEARRNWSNEGLAKFSLLVRNYQHSIEELSFEVIKFLVKYVNANQGGLFLVKLSEECLELTGCYAYNRKKFLSKKINFGEGLVGQAFLEKEKIELTEVSPNYMQITSGLGEATPGYLIIIPFVYNDAVEAVIEVACFKRLDIAEIQFLEKAGEIVGSAINSVRASLSIHRAFEEGQLKTEALRSQEEEMRQNMEELSSTQEEMMRKELEYVRQINDLERRLQINVSTNNL